mmetsp:Transcript_43707/g.121006  ORF Transcript_43707/g.121006 Transcript_43707/m.121006 type:complete len:314 (+) Transcript_43707:363-1304(+)
MEELEKLAHVRDRQARGSAAQPVEGKTILIDHVHWQVEFANRVFPLLGPLHLGCPLARLPDEGHEGSEVDGGGGEAPLVRGIYKHLELLLLLASLRADTESLHRLQEIPMQKHQLALPMISPCVPLEDRRKLAAHPPLEPFAGAAQNPQEARKADLGMLGSLSVGRESLISGEVRIRVRTNCRAMLEDHPCQIAFLSPSGACRRLALRVRRLFEVHYPLALPVVQNLQDLDNIHLGGQAPHDTHNVRHVLAAVGHHPEGVQSYPALAHVQVASRTAVEVSEHLMHAAELVPEVQKCLPSRRNSELRRQCHPRP